MIQLQQIWTDSDGQRWYLYRQTTGKPDVVENKDPDAERYKWLKKQAEVTLCGIAYRSTLACKHESADAAIDAAMTDPRWKSS